MPAALAVDWNEVKILALAIGVREAARQLELSEEAVMKRCSREGWLKNQRQEIAVQQQAMAEKRERQGLSAYVRTAAEVLKETGPNTRAKLAIAVEKQAESLAETDAQELVLMAQTVTTVINGAAKLHSWAINVQTDVRLDVLAAGSGDHEPVIDV